MSTKIEDSAKAEIAGTAIENSLSQVQLDLIYPSGSDGCVDAEYLNCPALGAHLQRVAHADHEAGKCKQTPPTVIRVAKLGRLCPIEHDFAEARTIECTSFSYVLTHRSFNSRPVGPAQQVYDTLVLQNNAVTSFGMPLH